MIIADNKWFTRVVVAAALIQTLDSLHLKYPEVGPDKLNQRFRKRISLLRNSIFPAGELVFPTEELVFTAEELVFTAEELVFPAEELSFPAEELVFLKGILGFREGKMASPDGKFGFRGRKMQFFEVF